MEFCKSFETDVIFLLGLNNSAFCLWNNGGGFQFVWVEFHKIDEKDEIKVCRVGLQFSVF